MTYTHSFKNPVIHFIAQRRIFMFSPEEKSAFRGSSCVFPLASSPLHQWRYFCHNVKLSGMDGAPRGAPSQRFFHDPLTLTVAFPPLSQQYWYSGNGCADVWLWLGSRNWTCGIFGRVLQSPIDCDPSSEIVSSSLDAWWALAPNVNASIPSIICSLVWNKKSPGTRWQKETADPVSCPYRGFSPVASLASGAYISQSQAVPTGLQTGEGSSGIPSCPMIIF